jgi:predicted enzyme related to lactoylglutathione lyase
MNSLPDMNYTMVIADPAEGINGGIRAEADPKRRGVLVYVEVDDLQAALDRAVSLGATVVSPAREIPGIVTLAVFTDPEGNRIGVVKSHH